jgi:hypothetical protein
MPVIVRTVCARRSRRDGQTLRLWLWLGGRSASDWKHFATCRTIKRALALMPARSCPSRASAKTLA